MTLINTSGLIGQMTVYLTNYVTGDLFLTYLIYVLIIIALLIAFRVGGELVAIIGFVMIFVLMAYNQEWLAIGGIIFVFFAAIITRRFLGGY